jgi:transposase
VEAPTKKEETMTTEQKLIKKKMSLLELAEYLKNVSEACRVMGVSRQHFYDIKTAYHEQGLEGLKEKSRRKPCIKNRVAPEVEEAVVALALRKKIYQTLEALQADLDTWGHTYNHERTHQGKRGQGRTPMQTFLDSLHLALEKKIA